VSIFPPQYVILRVNRGGGIRAQARVTISRVQGPFQVLGHVFSSGSAETKKELRILVERECALRRKEDLKESNIHFLEPEPPLIDREPTGIISNCAHSLPETASVEFPLVLSMAQDLGYPAQVMGFWTFHDGLVWR
jgi:hypothetical protein